LVKVFNIIQGPKIDVEREVLASITKGMRQLYFNGGRGKIPPAVAHILAKKAV